MAPRPASRRRRERQRLAWAQAAPWRLQTQLRRQLLGLLTVVWLLASTATGLGLWHETDEVLDSGLTETAQRLLLLPEAALAVTDTADHLATLGPHQEFVVYQVFDRRGQLRLHSHDAPAAALDADAPDGLRQTGDWRVLTLSAADGSRRAQVAESVAHRHEVLWASLGWLLGMLLAMLPLAALGVGWVLRRGFRSLEPARHDLTHRDQNDLRPLPPAAVPVELQPWLDTVNTLLERVRALVESERAFAANTAHELRTPLAAAMAQAQRLVKASTDPATRDLALALLRHIDRLTRLATRLLQLARIESGVALNHEPVDLVQLAMLVADDFAEAQRSGRLHLRVDAQPLPVKADIDALGIALRNLIDNALKHGGDDAQVTVHVDGQTLRVDDDGPGVAADQLPGLVRKFTRGGGGQVVAGNGLGLGLVETIARQSGARLVLRSPLANGHGFSASLRFDVDLPHGAAASSLPPPP
jgi:two-component system OmpR family sensor kinase